MLNWNQLQHWNQWRILRWNFNRLIKYCIPSEIIYQHASTFEQNVAADWYQLRLHQTRVLCQQNLPDYTLTAVCQQKPNGIYHFVNIIYGGTKLQSQLGFIRSHTLFTDSIRFLRQTIYSRYFAKSIFDKFGNLDIQDIKKYTQNL